MIVHTGVNGSIRQVTYDYEGYRTIAFVTPLADPVPGGDPETHVLVTVLTHEGNRAYVFLARDQYLARYYFDEKLGPFRNEHVGDAAYIAVGEALGREYERNEEDSIVG